MICHLRRSATRLLSGHPGVVNETRGYRRGLLGFGGGRDFRAFQGSQSFPNRRGARDEPHALAESFARSRGLASVPVCGVDGGAVAAQAQFSGRHSHGSSATSVSSGFRFLVSRSALTHGTPPRSPSGEHSFHLQRLVRPRSYCGVFILIILPYHDAFQYLVPQRRGGEALGPSTLRESQEG